MSARRPRYVLLDALRGLCILSMIVYHAMYDLVNIKGVPVPWFRDWPGYFWQQSICWTFILLSGLCWHFSRHPAYRGLLLTACGALVTLVTWLVMPAERILYGVLTLLGLSALLLNLLHVIAEKLSWHIPPWIGLGLCAALFFLLRDVPRGFLGFEGLRLWELPAGLYRYDALALLGFPSPGFSSSDYFPLIPWFFLYLAGHFLWKLLSRSQRVLGFLEGPGSPWDTCLGPFAFLGRHSLLIYLLHQPVIMGALLLFP